MSSQVIIPVSSAIRTVGIISKPNKEQICAVVPTLLAWLEQRGIKSICDTETAAQCAPGVASLSREELPKSIDLLIVLGGDGTLLAAARLLGDRNVPILPVNLGALGFLTSVTLNELYPLLELVLAGKHRISERMMLEAEVVRGGKTISRHQALNDAVVTKSDLARIIDLDVFVDGDLVGRFRADGLIVATPTGSTAYSLSAGGPIIYPVHQAFVITPICPHMLTNRPLVLSDSAQVEIQFVSGDEPCRLTVDGQVGVELFINDRVAIRKAKNKVQLVRPPQKTYFEVLRNKLRWSER
jgi:NAD+ kinase